MQRFVETLCGGAAKPMPEATFGHVHCFSALFYGALHTKRVLVRCLSVSVSLCFDL